MDSMDKNVTKVHIYNFRQIFMSHEKLYIRCLNCKLAFQIFRMNLFLKVFSYRSINESHTVITTLINIGHKNTYQEFDQYMPRMLQVTFQRIIKNQSDKCFLTNFIDIQMMKQECSCSGWIAWFSISLAFNIVLLTGICVMCR